MTIFVDRDKLSPRYIPERLPHREEEIKTTMSFFKDLINGFPCNYTRIIQFIGPTGMGKTCSAYHVMSSLDKSLKGLGIDFKPIYFNLKLEVSSKFVFYNSLAEKIDPVISSRSLSPSEQLREIVRYVKNKGLKLLLVIDEVDEFLKKSSEVDLVYDLTRLSEMCLGEVSGIVGIIFIARDRNWRRHLSKAERSTLGNLVVFFRPYNKEQVVDILKYRVSEAFEKGVIDDEVIEFVADVTVRYAESDIRYALDVLLYSGVVAENEGMNMVTLDHVRHVLGMFSQVLTYRDIEELDPESKIVLLSIARALKVLNKQYVSLDEVRSSYKMVCEEYGVKRSPWAELEEKIQELYERGIIDVRGVNKIGIINVPVGKLSSVLDEIIDNIVSGISF
mgnify:CR=1 FL=1